MSAEQQSMQTVKVTHCGQTKRTEFSYGNFNYGNLCAWLTTSFGVTVDGTTPPIPRLVYRDPEGDIVSVSSTSELLDAARLVTNNGALMLQLTFPRPRDRWHRFAATGGFGNLETPEAFNDYDLPVEANEAQETKTETSTEKSVEEPSIVSAVNHPAGKRSKEELAARRQALVAWRTAIAEARQNGTDLPPHPFLGMDHPVHHRFATLQAKKTARIAIREARAKGETGQNIETPCAPAASSAPQKTEYVPNAQPLLAYPMWASCTSTVANSGENVAVNPTTAHVASDRMLLFVPSLGKVFAPVEMTGTPNEAPTDNFVCCSPPGASPSATEDRALPPWRNPKNRGRRSFADQEVRRRPRKENLRFSVSIEPTPTESTSGDANGTHYDSLASNNPARLARLG